METKVAYTYLIFVCIYQQVAVSRGRRDNTYELQSPRVTNWGSWGSWSYCDEGYYVVAVQLKNQGYQYFSDDTGLNGIYLTCHSLSEPGGHGIESIEGNYGSWREPSACHGIATGFQLKSHVGVTDEAGAIDFVLLCDGPNSKYKTKPNGLLSWGSWTSERRCPAGHAICGIQTQVSTSALCKHFCDKILFLEHPTKSVI